MEAAASGLFNLAVQGGIACVVLVVVSACAIAVTRYAVMPVLAVWSSIATGLQLATSLLKDIELINRATASDLAHAAEDTRITAEMLSATSARIQGAR